MGIPTINTSGHHCANEESDFISPATMYRMERGIRKELAKYFTEDYATHILLDVLKQLTPTEYKELYDAIGTDGFMAKIPQVSIYIKAKTKLYENDSNLND